ncbi:hypothetical protein BCR41DRAFT_109467 [Lobosporangium transversale]|uniref:Uncharacterized protein n=1 Tax=Lobosporangium transversale TaxID=64571 RepID=A0A1Y2GKR1_9FUNG|nr:hypothetical protein BCR41DRAFT_109467 [Lobosporangium transversale]ORZ11767.1 hypothetical protein BCR41DRAFT_109467 [Lobosporangium transversale]|eukprot:XP_021879864.1 hypothetical protein BCR41DRAFT_109467 [Lobosporangium transversale]
MSFTGLEKNRSKKSLTPLWLQIGSNVLAMLIWGLSMLVHSMAWRYVMWYFTIVVEIIVLVAFGRRTSVTFAGSHLPERFALFTIIVLGENIIDYRLGRWHELLDKGNKPVLVMCETILYLLPLRPLIRRIRKNYLTHPHTILNPLPDPSRILFLLTTVILYALWWIYFDDFSEDVFHKTTTLSQLWAYLHLPFHVCIVLVEQAHWI